MQRDGLVLSQTTINADTLWRYHVDGTAPASGWNTPSFESDWPTSTTANLPAPQGKAAYYCASFDVTVASYATIKHTVTTRGGFAVYVNGHELGRSRLSSGELTTESQPTSESETAINVQMGTSFAAAAVKNTDNLVCVEVHTSTIDAVNNFAYSVSLLGKQDDLVVDGTLTGSHPGYHTTMWNEVLANAADKNNNNKFNTDDPLTCSTSKAWVQWTWSNERMESINYMKFYCGTNVGRRPYYLAVKASNDGNLWTELGQWTTQDTWSGSYSYREFIYANALAYRMYRVEFWGCTDVNEGIEMAEFYLGTRATVSMCQAQDGYTASYVDSLAFKECPDPTFLGGLYRRCNSDGTLDADVIDSCIPPIPSNLVYGVNNVVNLAVMKNEEVIPTYNGLPTFWSISPALPVNLNFDETTGIISGRIAEPIANAPYTVVCGNDLGNTTIVFTLTATIVNCEATETFPATQHGKYAITPCDPASFGYVMTLCQGGVFEPSDLTHCTPRAASVFSYGVESVTGVTGSALPTLSLLTDSSFTTYSIAPEVPEGLTFGDDASISGTPTTAFTTTFTITGQNIVETKTCTLAITVADNFCAALDSFPQTANGVVATSENACPENFVVTATRLCTNGAFGDIDISGCLIAPPSALSYSPSSVSVVSGEKIVFADPAFQGEVVSFSLSPAVSTLSVNSQGVVSGFLTTVGSNTFTVTATNSRGQTTATITITVSAARCTGLDGVDVASGDKVMDACPSGMAGEAFRLCTNGVLGMLDTSDCHTTAPSDLSYEKAEFVATENNMFFTNYPSYTGTVTSFSISPDLPTGLSLDTNNGAIAGSPAANTTGSATYTVVATNTAGETSTTFVLTVRPIMCEATQDLKSIAAGESLTFDCTTLTGYKGSYEVKCVLDTSGMSAQWATPSTWCIEKKLSVLTLVGIVLLVVAVLFLIWGIMMMVKREQKKTLHKTEAPKATTAPVAAKAPAPTPAPVAAPATAPAPAPARAPAPVPKVEL